MADKVVNNKKSNLMNQSYAAFPEVEHRERLARAREMLREEGLDGCICVGPEHLFYLGGFDASTYWTSQALVFSTDEASEPTLILRNVDLPLARETSWVVDTRTYHIYVDEPSDIIADVVREKGIREGRIGIDLQAYALPGEYAIKLIKALKPLKVEDATELLFNLQLFKSEREMEYIREAANYANAGLDAAREVLKPGITEIELAAAVEGAMRSLGSDYFTIPAEISSGPRTVGCHATPLYRTIERGDLVHFEYSGVARRYNAVVIHTMSVGDPGPRAREIYNLTLESLRAAIKTCRPGTTGAEIELASLEPLRRAGLEHTAMMLTGVGIGVGYPPIWVGSFHLNRNSKHLVKPGMVFYLHGCMELFEENIGVIQGATYVMAPSGELEILTGGGDVELEIV
jgi:Xaa-Pro aminopeptidase